VVQAFFDSAESPNILLCSSSCRQESEREVTVADGSSMRVPYVGPVKVVVQDRLCFVGALVLGDTVLLGAVPMADMDLTINPSRQCLEQDPRSPNIPQALVKGIHTP